MLNGFGTELLTLLQRLTGNHDSFQVAVTTGKLRFSKTHKIPNSNFNSGEVLSFTRVVNVEILAILNGVNTALVSAFDLLKWSTNSLQVRD